jgi:hypothetical protein
MRPGATKKAMAAAPASHDSIILMSAESEKTEQPNPPEGSPDAAMPPWRQVFLKICESLPETVEVPFNRTPEGFRTAEFKRVCDAEFSRRIDRSKLQFPDAFDRVALWDGSFPGPCAFGKTGTAKSRAAWSALARLYIRANKDFAWFPVKRLVSSMDKYEQSGNLHEFFRLYAHSRILFVDDLDKINWAFESQISSVFAFYDWIYRTRKPCITTTNKSREWWVEKMGEAFARRLFDDAHFAVSFGVSEPA